MENNNKQNININNSNNVSIGNISANINSGPVQSEKNNDFNPIDGSLLKKLIGENKILKVIDKLLISSKDIETQNEIYLMNSRYKKLITDKRLNIISESDSQLEMNKRSTLKNLHLFLSYY